MLDVLRRGATTWVSKLLLALLIVSFAIWGIADVFRGFGSNTVATVGSTHVTTQDFDIAYRRELDNLGRRIGKPLTREEALRFGLPTQMVSRMVSEAMLTEAARRMRIGVSDAELVRIIREDRAFQNAAGQFDRARFAELLRSNGWSEDTYVETARKAAYRQQLVDAVAGPLPTPKVMLEAVDRYRNEERTVAFVTLQPSVLGPTADPSAEELAKFFEERKAAFRAREFRKLTIATIDPQSIAKPGDVTDDDAQAEYQRAASRFSQPERRRVSQIAFDKIEDARAASDKIKAGTTFEAIVAERNLKPEDIDLGLLDKASFLDPKVAESAFALANPGDVSDVVAGRFRPVLLRLEEAKSAGKKVFDEVKDQLKAEIAGHRAETELLDVYKQIEDARAAGTPLLEVAKRFGMAPTTIEQVDRAGKAPSGETVAMPEADKVLKAAFESDVGVENDVIDMGGKGFLWFEVTGIVPARDRALDEVKDDVVARWKDEQVRAALGAKSTELVEKLKAGAALEDLAKELGLDVRSATALKRGQPADGLTGTAIAAAFGGPQGHVATAAGEGDARIVLQVRDVSEPAFFAESESAKAASAELANDIQNTLVEQYIRQLQSEIAPQVNQQLVARIVGAAPTN